MLIFEKIGWFCRLFAWKL